MSEQKIPAWVTRLVIGIFISTIALIASVYLLWKLSAIVSILVISLFLSFALEPFANFLVSKGWKRPLASIFIVLSFVFVAVALFLGMVPLVIQQIDELARQTPTWADSVASLINSWFGVSVEPAKIINQLSGSSSLLTDYGVNIANNVLDISRQIFFAAIQIFSIIMLTYYFVADAPKLRRIVCSFLPPTQQKFVLDTWELAITKTGNFMYSRGLLGLFSAIFTFAVLAILGVPFALPLAIWMGVVSQFLPVIGTFIAAALPIAVAFIHSPRDALIVLILLVVYQQIENYILGPKITAHTMEMHPAVALIAVLAGVTLGGVVGALVALPVAAILQESTRAYLTRHELIESELLKHNKKPKKHIDAKQKKS
ncbi:AI-2E family transporter [Candidatus Nomurabacteria bacterium]|nr:AI-2E family transporter [Candidatus Saccharibacteria bacterium]MCB9839233.1 AI-2E family transporter [Candidatus Nomurabacteria bacterium]